MPCFSSASRATVLARWELHEPRREARLDAPRTEVHVSVRGELDEHLGSSPLRRSADGDQPLEIGAAPRALEDRLGLLRELGQLHDRRILERVLGLVDQGAHRSRPDQREAIERRERARRNAKLGGAAIDQQASPAVREAVIEQSHQPVEDIGPPHHDARTERQLKRRQLELRAEEGRVGARWRLVASGRASASSSDVYAGVSKSLSNACSAPSAVAIRSTPSIEAMPVFSKRRIVATPRPARAASSSWRRLRISLSSRARAPGSLRR